MLVAIDQDIKNVREFGVYSEDHQDLTLWLLENDIKNVAMESTGNYWQNLFSALQEANFTVILANGRFH